MIRHYQLTPSFVKGIPRELEAGTLYVSMEYGTVIHSCCCGCGHEVVTPLTPTDWTLTFDGETISLWPSVGNWNLPCRSHYVIKCNRVLEAAPWDKAKIDAEMRRDKAAKKRYYAQTDATETSEDFKKEPVRESSGMRIEPLSIWSKLSKWLS